MAEPIEQTDTTGVVNVAGFLRKMSEVSQGQFAQLKMKSGKAFNLKKQETLNVAPYVNQ